MSTSGGGCLGRPQRRGLSALAHHTSAAEIKDRAGLQGQRLRQLGLLEGAPFALVTGNNVACAATLRAVAEAEGAVVLLPSLALLPLAEEHTVVHSVVHVDPSTGELTKNSVIGGACRAGAGSRWEWLDAFAESADEGCRGTCVVATSGSGQAGAKFVANRWSSSAEQAAVTAARTLRDAARGGARVRFVAASNIGHAYNLNGFFSAVAADAELCLPASAAELAASLAAAPADDCAATVVFTTPGTLSALAALPEVVSGDLKRCILRAARPVFLFSAGCPLPAEVRARIRDSMGVHVLQNYGSTETGNIALQDVPQPTEQLHASVASQGEVGTPWGRVELRAPQDGRLLPFGAEGEICVAVPWGSGGYVRRGAFVRHPEAPFFRTGDAGRWADGAGGRGLVVMQRLRSPICVRRGGLRLLLQPYEVEAAYLEAGATAAAALQGPGETLLVAVVMPPASWPITAVFPLAADRLLDLPELPASPAGKVLYSQIARLFEDRA